MTATQEHLELNSLRYDTDHTIVTGTCGKMKDKTNKIVVKQYFPVLFESLKLFYISIIIAKNKK